MQVAWLLSGLLGSRGLVRVAQAHSERALLAIPLSNQPEWALPSR